MARTFIAGGMAATQLQAGKPFFKRITRIGGDSGYLRDDGMTCEINVDGEVNFEDVFSPDWNAGTGSGGELIMVEFPTTNRETEVLLEEAWNAGSKVEIGGVPSVRIKVAFLAEGQDVKYDNGVIATPMDNFNFIEVNPGEIANIKSRTKVLFILVQKFVSGTTPESFIFNNTPAITQGAAGHAEDAVSILITSVLDHEPKPGRDF